MVAQHQRRFDEATAFYHKALQVSEDAGDFFQAAIVITILEWWHRSNSALKLNTFCEYTEPASDPKLPATEEEKRE